MNPWLRVLCFSHSSITTFSAYIICRYLTITSLSISVRKHLSQGLVDQKEKRLISTRVPVTERWHDHT